MVVPPPPPPPLLPPPPYCLRPVVLLIVPEPPTDFNSVASYELICANSVSPSSPCDAISQASLSNNQTLNLIGNTFYIIKLEMCFKSDIALLIL